MRISGVRECFEDENHDERNHRKQGGPMRTQPQHRKLNQPVLLPDRKLRLRVSLDLMNGLIVLIVLGVG